MQGSDGKRENNDRARKEGTKECVNGGGSIGAEEVGDEEGRRSVNELIMINDKEG